MTSPSDEMSGQAGSDLDDEVARGATVVLPAQRSPRPVRGRRAGRRRAPLVVAALVNAVWAALVSFLPMLGTVAAVTLIGPDRPALAPTVRFGIGGWLLAHGVPLSIAGQPIALVPLGVAGLAAWRCARAGRNTMRAIGARRSVSVGPVLAVAATIACGYGGIGALLAIAATGPDLSVPTLQAGLTLAVFGGVASLCGAVRVSRIGARWRGRVPLAVREGVRAAIVSVALLMAAGAVAVGASIAVAGSRATAVFSHMDLGIAAKAGIVLACLAYAPDLAIWAAAFLTGPGFSLGGVPPLPIFAGLPQHAVTGIGQALLATPLVAGCVAGLLLVRRRRRHLAEAAAMRGLVRSSRRFAAPATVEDGADGGRWTAIAAAALTGPFAALLIAACGYAGAGALGSGPLANTGQVGWQFAMIGGIGIGFGAMVAAVIGRTMAADGAA